MRASSSMMTDFPYLCRGKVLDNKDPLNLGRCRINIFSIYGDAPIKPSDLPWARSIEMMSSNEKRGSYAIPDVGDIVWVLFEGGDDESPVYIGGTRGTGDHPVDIDKVVFYQEDKNIFLYDRVEKKFLIRLEDTSITINDEDISLSSTKSINISGATSVNIESASSVSISSSAPIQLNSSDSVIVNAPNFIVNSSNIVGIKECYCEEGAADV